MTEFITKKIKLAEDFAEASADYRANPKLKLQSNCYSYALGIPEHGFGMPGSLGVASRAGFAKEHINASYIFNALMRDGLEPVRESDLDEYGERPIIACFLAHQNDYHFYLRHNDDFWSHQRGKQGEISNQDNRGMLIVNPRMAWRGRYQEFVGYFALPDEGLTFAKKLNWFEENITYPYAELKKWAGSKLKL
jgi:hypothetical protein